MNTLIPLLVFFAVSISLNAQNTTSSGQFEQMINYLTSDGILSKKKIDIMVESHGRDSLVQYAIAHGWQTSATWPQKQTILVDSKAVAAIDIEELLSPPTDPEVRAVWNNLPENYQADRFEIIGKPVEMLDDVTGHYFSYYSDGLKIYGYMYRPHGDGLHPAIILNHGGFGIGTIVGEVGEPSDIGDKKPIWQWCMELAGKGFVVLASGYRGTQTDMGISEGSFEGGRGEVTDVLNLLACARTLPSVDAERIGMTGMSHGGWITALAIQRTKHIKAAIAFFPPANIFFSKKAPMGGTKKRVLSMMNGKVLGAGAVGIVDKAVFLPLIQGHATTTDTRHEMIVRTAHLFADKSNTPLHIICGDKDPLYGDAILLHQSLKGEGKITTFKTYVGEKHGFNFRGSLNAIEESFLETVLYFTKELN